jgi:heme o synthase
MSTIRAHETYPQSYNKSLLSSGLSRVAVYYELMKPRISVMVLVTVTIGYFLASESVISLIGLLQTLIGISLVAVASNTLNQWVERDTDSRMERTKSRPLPTGRLTSTEVLLFGVLCGMLGLVFLYLFVNVQTTMLACLTMILYVGIYTPLKRKSTICTMIGAIPGALPPVLGWLAAGGSYSLEALTLFGILFMWQFPHFLAIAWIYKDQYEKAGLKMLPQIAIKKGHTGWIAIFYAIALIPVTLLASQLSIAGTFYTYTALILGLVYLISSIRFMLDESRNTARQLLLTSLVYLPLLLAVMTWDHFYLLS